jgi:HEAT repeat protein
MASQDIQDRATDTIMIMNTAITSLRLYPPTSAMITQTIERLLQSLTGILDEKTPLILAESERMLLFDKTPAWPKNQERPHIKTFVDLLINQGIKSVTFEKGLEKEELIVLLQALSRRPDEVRQEQGAQEILNRNAVVHIKVDEKIYMAKNVNEGGIGDASFKDEIVKFLMQASDTDTDSAELQRIKENAKDPEWINSVLQTWIARLREKEGVTPNAELAEDIVRMVSMMDNIVDPANMDRTSDFIAGSILEMDNEMISLILSCNVQGLFGGRFFENIVEKLDDNRFTAIAERLVNMSAMPGSEGVAASRSLDGLYKTEKGRRFDGERQARLAREREAREKRINEFREHLQGIIKGEETSFADQKLMAELPMLIGELYLLDDVPTAVSLIERLTEKLRSRHPDMRIRVAEPLSLVLNDLLAGGRKDQAGHLAERLAAWLRSETVYSSVCERVCLQLKEIIKVILNNDPFEENNPLLDIISSIQSGRSSRDQNMQTLAAEALRELATEDLLNKLFHEFETNEQGKQKDAAKNLGRLGPASVERLLDMLRESEDSDERVRILQTLSEIGPPSVPAIISRLNPDEHWYVLRNLVYALGRVGGEAQASDLVPLLLHENQKLQQEALKSLQRIGGSARAGILLSCLPKAGEQLKMSMVETLGSIKAVEAVPILVEMLQSKAVVVSSAKTDLDEKICTALGNIGSEEALPALTEIAKPKGFFTVRSYPEKVKITAGKAMASIVKRKA